LSITNKKSLDLLGYSPKELSEALSVSLSSLARDRANGCLGGIPFAQLGSRVVYPRVAIEEWLIARTSSSPYISGDELKSDLLVLRKPGRPKGTTKSELRKRTDSLEGALL
jgi:hypothetical protein